LDERGWRRQEDDVADTQVLAEFQERHRRWSDQVERLFMQGAIAVLVLLVLVQTLALHPALRRILNQLEGLEGYAWNREQVWGEDVVIPAAAEGRPAGAVHTLTVVLMNRPAAPEAKLLVGGKEVGRFRQGKLTVPVAPGQPVVVDGTGTAEALVFRVVGAPGLAAPALGQQVTTRGDRQHLGTVRLQRP
jgi:hypothetical protein